MPFNPYIYQAPDLVTPMANIKRLQQGEEQLGLLREKQDFEKQQFEANQVQKAFDNWIKMIDIDPDASLSFVESNPRIKDFIGIDPSKLDIGQKRAFQKDAQKYYDMIKDIPDPQDKANMIEHARSQLQIKYGGTEARRKQIESAFPAAGEKKLADVEAWIEPTTKDIKQVRKGEMPPPGYVKASTVSPIAEEKKWSPQITQYVNTKTGKIEHLDANDPEDIKKIKSGSYRLYERTGETPAETSAKVMARKRAQVKIAEEILGRALTEKEKKTIAVGGALESWLEQLLSGSVGGGGMVYDSKSGKVIPK